MKQETFRALRRLCRTALPSWLCSLLMLTAASFAGLAATIQTDKLDYFPGSTAIISGKGWLPGETVSLEVDHINADGPFGEGHDAWYVVADEAGNVSSEWLVSSDDSAGATFLLTANGGTSLSHAEWTFTDDAISANITSPTVGAPVVITFIPGMGVVVPISFDYQTTPTGTSTADVDLGAVKQ